MFFAALPTSSPQTQAEMTIEQVAGGFSGVTNPAGVAAFKSQHEPSGSPGSLRTVSPGPLAATPNVTKGSTARGSG